MDSEAKKEYDQFELLIQGLIDHQYGCCDDFMTSSGIDGLRSNIQSLSESGILKSSGVGNRDNFQQDKTIRGDKINWIEEDSEDESEIAYLKKIGRFINHLNNSCFTSIKSYESHYASYEKNSFYKRHLDQFKNQKGRQFSIILYLNEDWKEEDGGNLCLYLENGELKKIAPFGGRMIFFKSDETEHEVLPSFYRTRNSIAGWLKNE
jgi:SM-20-related protein